MRHSQVMRIGSYCKISLQFTLARACLVLHFQSVLLFQLACHIAYVANSKISQLKSKINIFMGTLRFSDISWILDSESGVIVFKRVSFIEFCQLIDPPVPRNYFLVKIVGGLFRVICHQIKTLSAYTFSINSHCRPALFVKKICLVYVPTIE